MKNYNCWLLWPPPFGVYIELKREGEDQTVIARREDFHPAFNVANLYWRFTGIAKNLD